MIKVARVLLFRSVVSPDPDFDSVAFKKVGPGEDEAEGAAGGEESLADDSSPPPPPPLLLRTSDVIQFFPPHTTVKSVGRNNARIR